MVNNSRLSDPIARQAELLVQQQLVGEIQQSLASIAETAKCLTDTSSALVSGLPKVWQEERQKRHDELNNGILQKQQKEFITKITEQNDRLQTANKKVNSRIEQIAELLQVLCLLLIGCVIGVVSLWLLIFPHQLSLARGLDGAMLEWLSTPDGRIMRRSFISGNRSLKECVRRGPKNAQKLMCLVEIK